MRVRTAALAAAIGAIALVLVVGLFVYLRRPPEPLRYTVRGIDISHHQGTIDWTRVAGAKVRFAYAKASEGADFQDPAVTSNVAGAARQGIATGVYHYFTFCAPGSAQAANFLATIDPRATQLPPAVDLEYVGNCANRPSRQALARELRAFLFIVEARYRRRPILYAPRVFFDRYLADRTFASYPLWIRDLTGVQTLPVKRTVLFRQFTEQGTIPGIRRLVDEDLFMGSEHDLALLAGRP